MRQTRPQIPPQDARPAWWGAGIMAGLLLLGLALPAAAQPAPQASQACRVACRVGQAPPAPEQRQCLAQCMAGQPISRDAAGQARPAGSQAVSPSAVAPAPSGPARPQAAQAQPPPQPPPPQRGRAAAAPAPPAQGQGRPLPPMPHRPGATYGAFYLGLPPSMSFGVTVAQRDRTQAHRLAETACRARGGNCSLQLEFSDACVAVMEGVRRSPSAFFMTSDPRTYIVRAVTLGHSGNPADAERMARDACTLRERGALTCRIVHAECGAR